MRRLLEGMAIDRQLYNTIKAIAGEQDKAFSEIMEELLWDALEERLQMRGALLGKEGTC